MMQGRLELGKEEAERLVKEYGSPLYVYDEDILRTRCQEVMHFCHDEKYQPVYSAKANTNIELLKIIRSAGLLVDAMSPGEIVQEEAAGYLKEEIFCCSNNMKPEEMVFAREHAGIVILDSLEQIGQYGKMFAGDRIGIRLNPGIGAGHHQKVITGGKTKFGIALKDVDEVQEICDRYHLKVSFLHEHVGSQFLHCDVFLQAADILLEAAESFPDVEEVDFGGGLGIPYGKEDRLDLSAAGAALDEKMKGKQFVFHIEPGRYIVGECGELLGTVTGVKANEDVTYCGTDIGFNVMMRHVLYGSNHELVSYSGETNKKKYTVTGNICESGDILGEDIFLSEVNAGDAIGLLDAGAYGFSMASDYNGRLKPAEVLYHHGQSRLIRKRETLSSLCKQI